MPRRLSPYLLLALLALFFFGDVVLHPTQVLYSDHSDLLAMHLPMKRFLVRSWHETGELPLWFPYGFAGAPFVHDVQVAMFYPPHWPLLLLPEERVGAAVTWLVVLHVVAAGWCMFALARAQGLGTAASLVAAIGYMFAGKWLLHLLAAGHTILAPLAWLPLAALLLDGAVRRGSFLRATGAGAAFALVVLGTHPQVTFYAGLFLALWGLGPALERAGYLGGGVKQRSPRPFAAWALLGGWAALVAVALSAVQLLPALEATGEATRGVGVEAAEAGQVLPALKGLAGAPLSRPRNYWEYQGNFGLLWLAAAALAPFLRGGRVRFQAAVAALLLLFGLGGGILLQGLPGFSLFQLPVRMFFVASLPVALLAAHATQALLDLPAAADRRRAVRVAALTLGACALLIGLPLGLMLLAGERPTFHPYWLLLALTGPAFLWLLSRHAGTGPRWAVLGVAVLTADLWALSRPALAVRPEGEVYAPSACVRELAAKREADPEPWRVLDRGTPKYPSSAPLGVSLPPLGDVALEPVLGYNTFDVRRTKEYLQFVAGADRPVRPRQGPKQPFGYPIINPVLIDNKPLLDLLGVRYLIASTAPKDRPELLKRDDGTLHDGTGEPNKHAGWQLVGDADQSPEVYSFLQGGRVALAPHVVYENREAFPRAFVVPRAEPLPAREKVLETLRAADLRETVFLADWDGPAPEAAGRFRKARVVEHRPNRVVVQADAGPAGYLVLADVWYPGWTCTVDGDRKPLYRADYLFRAVELPPGEHTVAFTFAPESFRLGRIISGAALAGVLGLLLLSLVPR